jgi:hypothetical protein
MDIDQDKSFKGSKMKTLALLKAIGKSYPNLFLSLGTWVQVILKKRIRVFAATRSWPSDSYRNRSPKLSCITPDSYRDHLVTEPPIYCRCC